MADHRRQAHLAQRSIRGGRRRAETLRVGRRRRAVVGRLAGSGAWTSRERHARSLHGEQHLPEDHGALRLRGSVGAQPESRARRHGRRQRRSRAGQRAALLHSEHAARRRPRRVQRDPRGAADVPGTELRHRHPRRQSRAAHRDRQRAALPLPQLGDEGHRAAGEQVPDARGRIPRRSGEGGDGLPDDPRSSG